MGFFKAALAGIKEGATAGLRIAEIERVLTSRFDHRPTSGAERQRLIDLIDYLPSETPANDVALCYLAVEVTMGGVPVKRGRAILETAQRMYKAGEVSEQMLREICHALDKRLAERG